MGTPRYPSSVRWVKLLLRLSFSFLLQSSGLDRALMIGVGHQMALNVADDLTHIWESTGRVAGIFDHSDRRFRRTGWQVPSVSLTPLVFLVPPSGYRLLRRIYGVIHKVTYRDMIV